MQLITSITSLLIVAASLLPVRSVHACTMPSPGLYSANFVAGVPDAQGRLNDMPNPNQLAEGDDLLLLADCGDCATFDLVATLTNAAGQVLPTKLEKIRPGWYWRLRPQQPLAAGQYTLKTAATPVGQSPSGEPPSYTFKVQGAASSTPLTFALGLSPNIDSARSQAGSKFECDLENFPCGLPPKYTQLRPQVDLVATAASQATQAQADAFLYRLLPSDMASAPDQVEWASSGKVATLVLGVSSFEQKAEYCLELEALRLRDLTRMSLTKRCLTYKLPDAPYDPAVFSMCKMKDPAAYARGWCRENLKACSASNPRADREEVRMACADYPTLCAPFVGNRSPDDNTCEP